jgi:hypothetical protein
VPFFHESEIKALDNGNTGKVLGNGRKQPNSGLSIR